MTGCTPSAAISRYFSITGYVSDLYDTSKQKWVRALASLGDSLGLYRDPSGVGEHQRLNTTGLPQGFTGSSSALSDRRTGATWTAPDGTTKVVQDPYGQAFVVLMGASPSIVKQVRSYLSSLKPAQLFKFRACFCPLQTKDFGTNVKAPSAELKTTGPRHYCARAADLGHRHIHHSRIRGSCPIDRIHQRRTPLPLLLRHHPQHHPRRVRARVQAVPDAVAPGRRTDHDQTVLGPGCPAGLVPCASCHQPPEPCHWRCVLQTILHECRKELRFGFGFGCS